MGVKRNPHKWTEHDKFLMVKYYGHEPVEATAKRIGVTPIAVKDKAVAMGLDYKTIRIKEIRLQNTTPGANHCESCTHLSTNGKYCFYYGLAATPFNAGCDNHTRETNITNTNNK